MSRSTRNEYREGVQAISKLDSKRPLQFREQSATVVTQLVVGMVKRLAHALPIDVAEMSQVLPVRSDSLLNQISACLDNGGQMPSPRLLVYNDDPDGCLTALRMAFQLQGNGRGARVSAWCTDNPLRQIAAARGLHFAHGKLPET